MKTRTLSRVWATAVVLTVFTFAAPGDANAQWWICAFDEVRHCATTSELGGRVSCTITCSGNRCRCTTGATCPDPGFGAAHLPKQGEMGITATIGDRCPAGPALTAEGIYQLDPAALQVIAEADHGADMLDALGRVLLRDGKSIMIQDSAGIDTENGRILGRFVAVVTVDGEDGDSALRVSIDLADRQEAQGWDAAELTLENGGLKGRARLFGGSQGLREVTW